MTATSDPHASKGGGERRAEARSAPTYRELEGVSLRAFGRMAGTLFLLGSLGAVGATVILAPEGRSLLLLVLASLGVLTGAACLCLPWERSQPSWHVGLGLVAIAEVFATTYETTHHYAILYLFIVICTAFFYRSRWVVGSVSVACSVALVGGALLQDETRHSLAVSFLLLTAILAFTVVLYWAREIGQRERARSARLTAEVIQVSLRLEAGRGRGTEPASNRAEQLEAVLGSIDHFLLALRKSPLRIDGSIQLPEATPR